MESHMKFSLEPKWHITKNKHHQTLMKAAYTVILYISSGFNHIFVNTETEQLD